MVEVPKIVYRADGSRAYVQLECHRKPDEPSGTCRFELGSSPGQNTGGLVWGWDGNEQAPTITPSINCHSCGLHVTITNGVESGRVRA